MPSSRSRARKRSAPGIGVLLAHEHAVHVHQPGADLAAFGHTTMMRSLAEGSSRRSRQPMRRARAPPNKLAVQPVLFDGSRLTLEHVDVLIVGAGLSGIGAGCHLQDAAAPARRYAILEARDAIGGTWDLFRYPGIRSDSDMYTLGYSFRPWTEAKAIADGPSILELRPRDRARRTASTSKIRFGHRVVRAEWSTRGRALDRRGRAHRHAARPCG